MRNLLFLTAMHGRHDTVQKCIDKMPNIRRLFVYSTDEDYEFIKDKCEACVYAPNDPLSLKWQKGLEEAKKLDFEGLVILGSDDYVDEAFINYVSDNISKHDLIGFKDIYFESEDDLYYWGGYTNDRIGEPIGAGRTINRRLLDEMGWQLWMRKINNSLDLLAWNRMKYYKFTKHIVSLKEQGLYMADVKDGQGITPLEKIPDLVLIKN